MPSPRIAEPSLPKDGRSPVQDSTTADLWTALAPIGVDIAQGVVVNEYEQNSLSAIQSQVNFDLERTRAAAAASAPQMDTVGAAGEQAVSQYARDISRIDNAVAQGAMGADTAKTRVNSITRDYARRFPMFASEFTSRNSGMEAMVDQAYGTNREFQLAERKAKEISAARDRMISLAINPDDAVAVDQYMKLEAAARQNAVVRAMLENKANLNAAEQELLIDSVENETATRAVAVIGETLNRFNRVTSTQPDAGANLRGFKTTLAAQRVSMIADVMLKTKGSPDSQRIIDNIKSMFDAADKATDFTEVAQIYAGLRSTLEDVTVQGVYTALPVMDRARLILGENFQDFFRQNIDLALNKNALETVMGQEGYAAAVASQERIAAAFYGVSKPTARQVTDANQRAALDAMDPKAPSTPVTALAGRELILNLRANANIPEIAIATAYEKTAGLAPGERPSLAQITARPRVLQAVHSSPVFQAQVRRELVQMNEDLAQYENVRLYFNNHTDPGNWTLKAGNRILMTRDPFLVNTGAETVEARMPAPNRVRGLIDAFIQMQDQGVDPGPAVQNMFQRWNPVINPLPPVQPANQDPQ